jgi:hypothetical protein
MQEEAPGRENSVNQVPKTTTMQKRSFRKRIMQDKVPEKSELCHHSSRKNHNFARIMNGPGF